jgi:hypothetical protein
MMNCNENIHVYIDWYTSVQFLITGHHTFHDIVSLTELVSPGF